MDILCPLINLYSVYLLGSNTVLGLDMSKHHTNLGDDQGRLRRKIPDHSGSLPLREMRA